MVSPAILRARDPRPGTTRHQRFDPARRPSRVEDGKPRNDAALLGSSCALRSAPNPGRANLPVSRRFPSGEGTSFSHPRLGRSLALPACRKGGTRTSGPRHRAWARRARRFPTPPAFPVAPPPSLTPPPRPPVAPDRKPAPASSVAGPATSFADAARCVAGLARCSAEPASSAPNRAIYSENCAKAGIAAVLSKIPLFILS